MPKSIEDSPWLVQQALCTLGEDGWEIINMDFRELEGKLEFSGVAKREINA